MSDQYLPLNDTLHQYIIQHNHGMHPMLAELYQLTLQQPGGRMQIPLEQLYFLRFWLKSQKIHSILELGTFTGFSALGFALALPADGRVLTCDRDDKMPAIGQPFWQQSEQGHKIDFRHQNAIDVLTDCQQNNDSFDLIFIDADKKSLIDYVKKSLTLLTENGVILVDNTLFKGLVADDDCQRQIVKDVRQFNDWLIQQPGLDVCLLPLGDGLTLIRRR